MKWSRSSGTARLSRDDAARIATDSLQEAIGFLPLRLSAEDLVLALEAMQRDDTAVDIPVQDCAFWDAHSGITADSATVSRGSGRNAASQVLMDSSSLTAAEVAENLCLAPSTVQHYKAERKLYTYLANGRLLFPTWQFTQTAGRSRAWNAFRQVARRPTPAVRGGILPDLSTGFGHQR